MENELSATVTSEIEKIAKFFNFAFSNKHLPITHEVVLMYILTKNEHQEWYCSSLKLKDKVFNKDKLNNTS